MMENGESNPSGSPSGNRPRVLDTSAILSGKQLTLEGPTYAPDAVIGELKPGGRDRRALDYLLEAGLRVQSPSRDARRRAEAAATRTGDSARLSAPDLDVVALSLELDATVVTDDYSVQNVAAELGLPFTGVSQDAITEVVTWTHRCTGCRRTFPQPVEECPVCGSGVRTVRSGARPVGRGNDG